VPSTDAGPDAQEREDYYQGQEGPWSVNYFLDHQVGKSKVVAGKYHLAVDRDWFRPLAASGETRAPA